MNDLEWKISADPVAYPAAQNLMETRVEAMLVDAAPELVWLLEHPPLYTAGTSADPADLLTPDRFPVYMTGRGGQYTYHGPGQRVGYVMLDLRRRQQMDLRAYVWRLEEWLIRTLAAFDVQGERRAGRVGIWVPTDAGEAKIAAIGVRVRRWVTFHGVALNHNPALNHYAGIVPCGLKEYPITSLTALGRDVSVAALDAALRRIFFEVFAANTAPCCAVG